MLVLLLPQVLLLGCAADVDFNKGNNMCIFGGGSSPAIPPPPPPPAAPPPPPVRADAPVQQANLDARRRASLSSGRSSTILSGALGPATTTKKSLLGT